MWVYVGIADLPNAAILLGTGLKLYFLLLVCISDSGWLQNHLLNLLCLTVLLTNLFKTLFLVCCIVLNPESSNTCTNEI